MKGLEIRQEDFYAMWAAVPQAGRQFGRWVMTKQDYEDITRRFPTVFDGHWTHLCGEPVEIRDDVDGISFVPGEPPLPGVFLDVGDTIEYRHCTDPACPAVREGYSHAHRGRVVHADGSTE